MEIRNQIRISVLISVLIVAAIAFSFVISSQNVQDLQQQESLAADVVRGGYELTYLSNNYIINAEPRARTQWEERYTSLQPVISQLKPTTVEETKSIESIRDYNEKVGTLFREIPEPGALHPGSTTFPPGFQQVTWSRSNVQSQGMIYEAWRLRHLYNDDVNAARLWNNALVLALMAAMLLVIIINYLLISRRLVRSIREVNEGSDRFGSGDLDYRIPVSSDDEIGGLARRLNTMAGQLRSVTASRDELDNEITCRRQAEGALVESERKYRNLYQYAQVGLFETSFKDATIVACNQRYADLAGFASVEDAIGKDILHLYVNPEDREEVGRTLREQGFIENQTLELRNQSTGKIFWAQFSARFNFEREVAEGSIIDITAQIVATENLRVSEEQYRQILDTMQDAYFRADPTGTITMANPAAAVMYGYPSAGEMVGIPVVSLYASKEDRDALFRHLDSSGRISDYPGMGRRKDGSLFWVSINVRVTFDSAGKIQASEGFVRDVTARKQTEAALEERTRFFDTMFESLAVSTWISDEKGTAIRANPSCLKFFGATEEEVIGKYNLFNDVVIEKNGLMPEIKRVFATGQPARITIDYDFGAVDHVHVREATHKFITSVFTPIVSKEGNVTNVVVQSIDLTEIRMAEERLRASEKKLRDILDSTPFPVAIVDSADNTILYWSRSAMEKFGHTAPTAAEWYELAYPDPAYRQDVVNRWKPFLEMARTSGQPVNTGEYRIACKDGSVRICELYAVFLVDNLIVTFNDITERKQAEDELRTSEERFRGVFDRSTAGKSLTAPDGRLLQINPAFAGMLGYTVEELQQMDFAAITYPDDLPESRECVRVLLSGEKMSYRMEKRYIHKTGRIVWADVSTSLLKDSSGRPVYLMTTILDITERKVSLERLASSETRYRRLFESAKDGILILNRDNGEIIDANPFIETLLGYAPKDLLGKHLWDIGLFKDQLMSKVAFEDLQAKDYIRYEDLPLETKDGRRIEVEFVSNVYPLDSHTSVIQCNIRDITDRKKAEEALRETNEYLQNLLNYANAPVIVWDREFRITRFNHAFENLTGRAEQEVLGQHLSLLFPDASRETSLELIRKTLAGERWEVVEIPIQHISGKVHIVLWNSANIVDSQGTIISTIAQGQDITGRKTVEDALHQSEEKYRNLFTQMVEGSALHEMVYDDSGKPVDYRILDVNPSFESVLGIRRDAILGKTSREAYGVDEPPYLDVYARVADTGQPEWFEVYYPPMNRHFSISAYSTRKGRFATMFEDITDSKKAAELRERLITELEQKNAELERFTYTVSHDLKSPLITIRGFAGLIEDDARSGDPVQLKKDVQRITAAADTMQELLADVLELSRIGRVVSPPEKTSFGTIAHEAVDLLAGQLAERGVRIDIAPDLPFVSVDHARIREVMVNLIENAVKFSGDQQEPRIRIGVETDGPEPVFYVRDNGIGIDPHYLERIFNLFERLDVSTHGTGIGLTIVRRIIEVHGGKIWAESEGPGKGTTFRFTLPGHSGKENDGP